MTKFTITLTIWLLTNIYVYGQLFIGADSDIEIFEAIEIPVADSIIIGQGYSTKLIENKLIFSDNPNGKIFYLDIYNGNIRSIGSRGRGPGEFDTVFDMAIENDTLFVYDSKNLRIQVFDNNSGKFVESVLLEKAILGFSKLFINDDIFYITGHSYNNNFFVHKFDRNGSYIESIIDFIDFSAFFNNLSSRIQLSYVNYASVDNYFYLILGAPYKIKKLDRTLENEIWEYKDDLLPNPWEDHIVIRPDFYETRPYPTTSHSEVFNNLLFIYIIDPDIEVTYLDIRNISNGDLINRIQLPYREFVRTMKSSSDNEYLNIVTTNTDNNSYKIYKIKIN